MHIVLYALGGLLLLAAIGAVVLFLRMRKYLASSQESVEGTVSEIAGEIESYQEKTQ